MLSSTEICNMALSHLGTGKAISDLENDSSQEAQSCRVFFTPAVKQVMRDFVWPFTTVMEELSLVEEDPNDEWAYSYRYPSDCLMFRRILSGNRNDTPATRIEFKLGQDDDGLLVFTDVEDAECEYTSYISETGTYPIDFCVAVSYLLAAMIAPRMTAGDPYKLGPNAMQMYLRAVGIAKQNAFNEQGTAFTYDSDLITERN